ncbi:hypothetical protein MOJ79_03245 [Calidifontimicrobium sp. SYSU G02091]|uniref:sensor histidine kinase n=1 Tax=Calidifontimicrobium sp. SYSU G02091 TaxID=2926421 RepID=UPI001F53C41A|nr:ATP-binding protein [Calidifontimicrobium sp. SYSU G02091]MCI1190853.1 hypothetical protein [Calidifontimicrobium sp. SYSU G02091]
MRAPWFLIGLALALAAALWLVRPDPARAGAVAFTSADVLEAGRDRPRKPPGPGAPWQPAALPDNWDGRRPGYEGYVWYRLALPALEARRPALYLPAVGMNAELWLGERRIGAFGRMDAPPTRHFYTPLLFELPDGVQAGAEVLLLVAGVPGYRNGLAPAWVGAHDALYPAWRWRSFWQNQGTLVTVVLNVGIGLYVLLIGLRERSHRAYAWFGAAAIVWGLRDLNYVVTDPPLPDLVWAQLVVVGSAWFTALFAIFALRFSEGEDAAYRGPRWLPGAMGVYMAVTAVHFLSAPDYASSKIGFAPLATVGMTLVAWSQWRLMHLAWRVRQIELVAIAAAAVLYFVLLVRDFAVMTDTRSLGEYYLRQYAALPLFFAITATLARRYLAALREAREAAATLTQRVAEQARRLEDSYARLREVEKAQALAQERARLMGDLHDSLGLHLVTALRQARSAQASPAALAATLQDCLDDLRVAIDSLDLHERDPLALLGSLRFRMAPRFESLGLRLDWHVDDDLGELPTLSADASLDLLRIVQEALTNALKHSGARRVAMSLRRTPAALVVEVRDDGSGFTPMLAGQGRGLGHMQQRAVRLGAALTVTSDAGGTAVRLALPTAPGTDVALAPPPLA